jgi:hypothetical protein
VPDPLLEGKAVYNFQIASDTLQCTLLVAGPGDGDLTDCNTEWMYFICISQQFYDQIDLMARGFKR